MKIPETPPSTPADFSYSEVLDDLVKMEKFWEFIEVNNNQFPFWDKWKYIAKDWNYDARKLWAAVQSGRMGNHLHLTEVYSFRLNSPSIMQEYLHYFDMNLGGSLQGDGIIPAQEKERYLISSLMEEAIASSQLEGAVTTRKIAREMLETNRKPRNESEQMILNNYEGMKWIVANKDKSITIENLLELHRIITKDTLSHPKEEGAFRTDNNVNVVDVQTGEIVYHPPSYDHLPQLMDAFCEFANDKQVIRFFMHPIAKGITLHFMLGFIHPFSDGNGRTARSVFYWYLIKKGYWLLEYMSVSRIILKAKAQYARAYLHTEIDNNDLTYFILYNLQCMKSSLEELKKFIDQKTHEKKRLIALLRNSDFNERQILLLREILQDTAASYSVGQLEKWFHVSNQTARNDLNKLVDARLLEFRKAGKQILYFPVSDFEAAIRKISGS